MPVVRKKIVKGRTYYYLEHSIRKNGEVQKKEVYLGNKIPKDIDAVKMKLLDGIYGKKWRADA